MRLEEGPLIMMFSIRIIEWRGERVTAARRHGPVISSYIKTAEMKTEMNRGWKNTLGGHPGVNPSLMCVHNMLGISSYCEL